MLSTYRSTLRWVLDNPALTLIVLLLTIALNVVLIVKIPRASSRSRTPARFGGVQGPQDASFPVMNNSIRQLVGGHQERPRGGQRDRVHRRHGATNGGFIYIALKPLNERKIGAAQIINRLRPKLNRFRSPPASCSRRRICASAAAAATRCTSTRFNRDNVQDLSTGGPSCLREMKKLPGFQDVNSDQQNGGLEELLTYDRVTAARLGITAQSLDSALYSAFGQSEVSIIYTQLNQYYVVLEVAPQYWQTPEGSEGHLPQHALQRPAATYPAHRRGHEPRRAPRRWPSTTPACSPRSRSRSIWPRTSR